ncbi:MAG: universal stress protein [archaeon]
MYEHVLVPVDGSDGGSRAVDFAVNIAKQYDSELYAIFVVDRRQYGEPALSSVELMIDDLVDYGQDLLKEIRERAETEKISYESRCSHGIPEEEILDYAEDIDADLIVMGYQGQTHVKRIGSTVDHVLRDTDRSVMAV